MSYDDERLVPTHPRREMLIILVDVQADEVARSGLVKKSSSTSDELPTCRILKAHPGEPEDVLRETLDWLRETCSEEGH